uniref:Uncharacterized protein n=1 Tax=Anguilla anguilla TaxID=7936 RepID=A0A0E9R689_ANGAN
MCVKRNSDTHMALYAVLKGKQSLNRGVGKCFLVDWSVKDKQMLGNVTKADFCRSPHTPVD